MQLQLSRQEIIDGDLHKARCLKLQNVPNKDVYDLSPVTVHP
jgi:hypothetical protein